MTDFKDCKPRYSGPNCSGICVCGHPWRKHHLSCVMRQEYIDATGEVYVPDECLFYGFNEMGGKDEEGKEHCWKYRDSMLEEGHN